MRNASVACWMYAHSDAMGVCVCCLCTVCVCVCQELVDCTWTDHISDNDNNGCEGGLSELAYDWLKTSGQGADLEVSYPYKMQVRTIDSVSVHFHVCPRQYS